MLNHNLFPKLCLVLIILILIQQTENISLLKEHLTTIKKSNNHKNLIEILNKKNNGSELSEETQKDLNNLTQGL